MKFFIKAKIKTDLMKLELSIEVAPKKASISKEVCKTYE